MESTSSSHSLLLLQRVQRLYEAGKLLDVTLVCQGQSFPAHSLVLATFSCHLKSLLTDDEFFCQEISVDALGISADVLRSLLNFMYTGVLCVVDDVVSLITAATKLGIQDALSQLQSWEQVSKLENELAPSPVKEDSTKHDVTVQLVKKEPIEDDVPTESDVRETRQSNHAMESQPPPEKNASLVASDDYVPQTLDQELVEGIVEEIFHMAELCVDEPAQNKTVNTAVVESETPKRRRGRPRKVDSNNIKTEPFAEKLCASSVKKSSKDNDTHQKNATKSSDSIKMEMDLDMYAATDDPYAEDNVNDFPDEASPKQTMTKSTTRSQLKQSRAKGRLVKHTGPRTDKSVTRKSRIIAGTLHCEECDYSTKTSKSFYNHYILKHTDTSLHQCDHCPKTFKLRKYLVSHLATHSGLMLLIVL